MLAAARDHRHAVVIGGGLLGLEAANGLQRQGMEVTVVHVTDSLMDRQLDKSAAGAAATRRSRQRACASCSKRGHRADRRRRARDRRAVHGRQPDPGGPGGDDRRRAPQYRTGGKRAACIASAPSSWTTRSQTLRPAHLRRGRMRAASPAPPSAWWRRSGTRRVCAAHLAGAGHRRYVQQATADQAQGHRRGPVFGGRFHRRPMAARTWCCAIPRRGVYKRLVLRGRPRRSARCCTATCRTAAGTST